MLSKLKNLYAQTSVNVPGLPPYISVNVTGDNTVTVSVRSVEGEHSKFHMTFDEWRALKNSPDPEESAP
jgi:hypothetical protein